jgi:hypothetical protein
MNQPRIYIKSIHFIETERNPRYFLTSYNGKDGNETLGKKIYVNEYGDFASNHPKYYDSLSEAMQAANKLGFQSILNPNSIEVNL